MILQMNLMAALKVADPIMDSQMFPRYDRPHIALEATGIPGAMLQSAMKESDLMATLPVADAIMGRQMFTDYDSTHIANKEPGILRVNNLGRVKTLLLLLLLCHTVSACIP